MPSDSRLAAVILAGCIACPPLALAASEWPHFRGPDRSGAADAAGIFDEGVGLEPAWQRPLGAGYSAISVAGGAAVTMFSDGDGDFVAAFDPHTGLERWRYRLEDRYVGHSGSADGPSSTPAIADGVVYALSRRGLLVALGLGDGEPLWTRRLEAEVEAREPHYGYATTPLVAGTRLVVQTGGPSGHSITAFDRATGAPLWSTGEGEVEYQSPTLVEIDGREQIVALDATDLAGLDPETGEVLWRHPHGVLATEAFALPLAIGAGRLVVPSLGPAAAFEVRGGEGGWTVEELWRSPALGRSYAIPVHHEGYLYGFKDRFLTCVDAATGEVVWKSRPPGGRALTLVDGHLVILSPEGELVVAEASPEGYRERARLALFERDGATAASFAEGRLYVRNEASMAAVEVVAGEGAAATAAASEAPRELLGALGPMVREAESADDPGAVVDAFLARHESLPAVEDGGLVHFLYRGEVEELALAGTFLGFSRQLPMHRVAGTDLWFRSVRLDPEAVWEYQFNELGRPIVDPENPHTIMGFFGPSSVLRMPQWEAPGFLGEPEGPRGRLDSFEFHSEIRGNTRRIQLWLPPEYEGGEARYPLMIYDSGAFALGEGGLETALDNLVGERVAPVIVAALPFPSLEEGGGAATDEYVRFLADELVPHLDRHYRTVVDPESRAVMGQFSSGTLAIYAALAAPETFGKAAAQSLYTKLPMAEALWRRLEARTADPQLYVEWARNDLTLEDGDIDCAADTQALARRLEEHGYRVTAKEVAGSWGPSSWGAQYDDILGLFFPAGDSAEDSEDPGAAPGAAPGEASGTSSEEAPGGAR